VPPHGLSKAVYVPLRALLGDGNTLRSYAFTNGYTLAGKQEEAIEILKTAPLTLQKFLTIYCNIKKTCPEIIESRAYIYSGRGLSYAGALESNSKN